MPWLADTDLGAAHGFARALCRGPYSDRAAPPNAGRARGARARRRADVGSRRARQPASCDTRQSLLTPSRPVRSRQWWLTWRVIRCYPRMPSEGVRLCACPRPSSLAACPTASCTAICSTRRAWSTPSRLALYPGVRAGFLAASSCACSATVRRARDDRRPANSIASSAAAATSRPSLRLCCRSWVSYRGKL